MSDGDYELWIADYINYNGTASKVYRSVLFRVPDGMAGAVRVRQLMRERKLLSEPDLIRIAEPSEVREYFSRHPEKLLAGTTEIPFDRGF